MKLRIVSLIILCLGLAVIPAVAQWSYDNGPINGTTDAWTINFGYIVSDTFLTNASPNPSVTGFQFGVWEFPGDVLSSVDWSITTGENGGTVIGSGTASGNNITDLFISTNQYGYDIDKIQVSTPNVSVNSGTTYWLNLQNAARCPVATRSTGMRTAESAAGAALPVDGLRECRRHDSWRGFHRQRPHHHTDA